jgi:glucose-6-phosphate dehydrogenase assembly protein OpcA
MAAAVNDTQVDYSKIERSFAEYWRHEKDHSEGAVTRAALWNGVAHASDPRQQAFAAETLAAASEAVPQRTIVVCANPDAPDSMSSWISANCHLVGGNQQVCSEEVLIVAEGERVHHVAPLVSALLLPDMPVAVWWVGDLPSEREEYVAPLLEPADRLIVDSSHFSGANDLALLSRIAEETTTAPADLNWVRLEEWRAATASVFDPPQMREKLRTIGHVTIVSGGDGSFGPLAEGLLFVAWLRAQTGREIDCTLTRGQSERGIESVDIRCDDASMARLRRDRERDVIVATVDGIDTDFACITRLQSRGLADLIVRQLKRPEADKLFVKVLRIAREMAEGREGEG